MTGNGLPSRSCCRGAGIGIIVGGIMGFKYFIGLGDMITRFGLLGSSHHCATL